MNDTRADAALRSHIASLLSRHQGARIGVAVSGGGDSMALLHLLAEQAPAQSVTVQVATVDHGLRPEAAEEAKFVKTASEALDCQHETLCWQGWNNRGNLQAEARRARYALLADWARRRGLEAVALGHTMDDQAETFLMRLSREAGVDGLSAMDGGLLRNGALFWRPLLQFRRSQLRAYLTRHGHSWRDDPSNDDDRFDRVKARKALAALAPLGIDAATLAGTARNLSSARAALEDCTHDLLARIAREDQGDILLDELGLISAPWELQRRIWSAALVWVSGADYPPRREALIEMLAKGHTCTLHGCLVTADGNEVRIAREYNAVKATTAPFGKPWDHRWHVTGPGAGTEIRALGEAVKDCPDWRDTGHPRASLMATPSVWQGERLIAAPIAGFFNGFSAEIVHPQGDFVTSVLTH